jgi:hypothetical protein
MPIDQLHLLIHRFCLVVFKKIIAKADETSAVTYVDVISYTDPHIDNVDPGIWCVSGSTQVTITGTNFGVISSFWTYISVFTNERAAPTITSITDTEIVSGYLPHHTSTSVGMTLFLAWNDPATGNSGPYTSMPNAGYYEGTC